jgi:predicted alpha/beta superfamily hydrolase
MQTEMSFADLGPTTMSRCSRYALASRNVAQTYLIDVAMPAAPVAPGQILPVVYVLDGNGMFAMAVQAARFLQSAPRPLPPMLVVGVGYDFRRGGGPNWEYGGLRLRDYSPSSDPRVVAEIRAAPSPYVYPPGFEIGGAAAFRRFLTEELRPFLAARYPVDPDDQTLLGFSLGGLFALDTLFTAPGSFRRYIAGSPALPWHDRIVFRREAALAANAGDLAADLFLSAGELEAMSADPLISAIVSTLCDLEAVLRGRRYQSLRMACHVFPGETHASVIGATISRGLRSVFG